MNSVCILLKRMLIIIKMFIEMEIEDEMPPLKKFKNFSDNLDDEENDDTNEYVATMKNNEFKSNKYEGIKKKLLTYSVKLK